MGIKHLILIAGIFSRASLSANAQAINISNDQYHLYGPNSTWGQYLQVGGNGQVTDHAFVAATNGNLHLDSRAGFSTYINYYNQGNTLINPQGGNVGIGTTFPTTKFEVMQATSGWTMNSRVNAPTVGEINGLKFYSGYFGEDKWAGIASVSESLHSNKTGLALFSGMTERLRISGDGNVGIGTNTPRAFLDVANYQGGGNLSSVFSRLPEGDGNGEGTYLGIKAYGTQPAAYEGKTFSLEHSFYGHTNNSVNFYRGVGETGGFMTFNTNNNTERMRIDAQGNIGIGTNSPFGTLHLNGAYATIDGGNSHQFAGTGLIVQANTGGRFGDRGAQLEFVIPASTDGNNAWGQARIITVAGNNNNGDATGTMILGTRRAFNKNGKPTEWFYGDDVVIVGNGNVGINTGNPTERLTVNGKIKANEIRVDGTNAPDYVFEESYKVVTLAELESYIKANKHLPEMPSAKEFERDGMAVGEMNKLLLKKIEELTLHLIEKDKVLIDVQKRLLKLEKNKK